MSKRNDRIVSPRPDGSWANKRQGADRAASIHTTQREAEKAARETLQREGGGELITQGRDGQFRSKDTIAPGNDTCPPKDREH
jgi:hypothetical protein